MQEKSYDEVARMLDVPIGTVKTHLFRARKMLAEELGRRRVRKGGS
jgi:RNA polymerase sigma-70 factor (ECF subfamily)